jgi:hypothetical protein
MPFSHFAPALTGATRWAELTARQRCSADSLQVVRQWVLPVLLTRRSLALTRPLRPAAPLTRDHLRGMARYAEHDRTAIDAVAEDHYNTERNHSSLANRPPVTRVRNDRGRTAS